MNTNKEIFKIDDISEKDMKKVREEAQAELGIDSDLDKEMRKVREEAQKEEGVRNEAKREEIGVNKKTIGNLLKIETN